MFSTFAADNNTKVVLQQGPPSTITNYIGFNEQLINATWREAMSYAFNYSYYLQDLLQGMDQPMLSPIPMGVFGAVDTLNAPIYNVTFAHQILLATGIPQQHGLTAANSTADWDSVVANLDPLAEFNYTYNTESLVRQQTGTLLQQNMADIGIDISLVGYTWPEFITIASDAPQDFGLYALGWMPDYNDPSDYIDPMFVRTFTIGQ